MTVLSRGASRVRLLYAAIAACLLAAAAAPPAALAAFQDRPGDALRRAEEALADALVAQDEDAFDRLLAPDFVMRGTPDVTRAQWIENAVKFCWGDRADISEFRVLQSADDRAVVALVLTTAQDPVTCEPASVRSLVTDIWERRDGEWRLVIRHSGPAGGVETQFVKAAAPPPVVEGSAELSLVDTGGNTNTQTLGTAGLFMWRREGWTTEARTSFVRSAAEGVETARTFTLGVRQSRTISPRLDAFARLEYLINEFAGIDNRFSFDAGLGYRLVEGPAHTLRTDAGIGYSREDRLTDDDLSFALATAGASYQWTVNRTVTITDTTLFTASLQDGEDWRFRNALAATTTLTRLLSVKLSHELNFAHAPAAGFGQTDTVLSAALVLKF